MTPDPCPPPDAAHFPYAQDLDGVWHRRPADDGWTVTNIGPNCHTDCGKAIWSVRASTFCPEADEARCACCVPVSDNPKEH